MGIRKPHRARQAARAVCPGCVTRDGGVITPTCPVCAGRGTITLGQPALAYDTPATVARAIALVLEATATAAVSDDRDRAAAAPTAVPDAVARLITLGLLDPT